MTDNEEQDRQPQDHQQADAPDDQDRQTEFQPAFAIVGIGASAGGLAALRTLFRGMPTDPGIACVVVVHLSPEHESHLVSLLQSSCPLPVQQVSETVELEPNRVYVIPPNANLETIDSHLRLSDLEPRRAERAPIDHFLRTLAETHNGDAIGVILSGTGSDGTIGLRWIKEQGGLTIAQDPNEAEYDGMPRSAIASGMVDRVLPLALMTDEIVRFARTRPRVDLDDAPGPRVQGSGAVDDARVLQKIFAQLRARTGQDFSRYKRSTILRRIRRRMQLQHVETLDAYLEILRERAEEAKELVSDLLITVTEFFRDREVFETLEQTAMPQMFAGKDGAEDRVRIWSVGCSTGEEAYSLAILMLEQAARSDAHPQLQVFASDLHERALGRAREGVYPAEIAANVSSERLKRYFAHENGSYRVRREVRDLVVFASHNLLSDPPFSHLDLIVCRNLMIYLQRDVQHDVLELFHYALAPQGLLLLGPSESNDRNDLFVREDKGICLYRKRNVTSAKPRLPVFPLATDARHSLWGTDPPTHAGRPAAGYGAVHERMVERYAPPSVLINAEHEIVHTSTRAGRYLRMPGGEPTANVFKLLLQPLQIELRSALGVLAERRAPVASNPVSMEIEGRRCRVVLRVGQAKDPELGGFVLVIFDELPSEPRESQDAKEARESPSATTQELEADLELTKQRLQAFVEEYETSREEMQASNEELQSANEELRSTMEELETSKEELQSVNEELVTVNQENRNRVEELSQLSTDLQNLLTATEVVTLFLDRELRIVRFTPQVHELFNVRPTDRGRPLPELTNRLGYAELEGDARRVLERLGTVEREVLSTNGRWYLTRVLPYRGQDDRIDGVVITLLDITERKQVEEAAREHALLTMALEATDAGWGTWHWPEGAAVWSEQARRILGFGPEDETTTTEDWLARIHPQDRPKVERELGEATSARRNFELEYRVTHGEGDIRHLRGTGRLLHDEPGRAARGVGLIFDVTAAKAAEAERQTLIAQLEIEVTDVKRLQRISNRLDGDQESGSQGLYDDILEAAMELTRADMGSLQMLERDDGGALRLLSSRGFHPKSVAHWERVTTVSATSCGRALAGGARVTVPDIERADWLAGTDDLAELRRSGVRSMQTTPLVARSGTVLGMISTHWRQPYTPSERDLRLLDVLVRQAADLVSRARWEQQLHASEAGWRSLVEAAAEVVWSADAQGGFEASASWEGYTGQPPEASRGDGWLDAIHPEDRSEVETAWRQALNRQAPLARELRLRHAESDGHRRLSARVVPLWGPPGQPIRGWIGVAIEVAVATGEGEP